MANEIQFLLYNMPDEDGKVQVVIKDENTEGIGTAIWSWDSSH